MINHDARRQTIQEKMKQNGMDGFLVTQNVDLFYFTGSMQSGYLFIPAEGEACFYVRRSLIRAQEESAVITEPLGSFRAFGERLAHDFPRLFVNKANLTIAAAYDVLPLQLFQRLEMFLPAIRWVDGSQLVRETRMIKSPYEITKMKQAAHVVDVALERAIAQIEIGMTELELISTIELHLRLQGHLGIMRMRAYNQEIVMGMVGSGAAAAKPSYFDGPAGGEGLSPASPQGAGRKRIECNEPILVDIGCSIDGYVIDQTRTLVIGELPEDMARAYRVSEHILQHTESMLRPGTICEELYLASLKLVESAGLMEHYMGYGEDQVRFLGHGIGLEIDELPVLAKGFKQPLEPGMVIAIEPKFTFPHRGVVGIENSYAITENGYEKLTCSREGIIAIKPTYPDGSRAVR